MTLVMIFHVFFHVRIRVCFRFVLIGGNLTAQSTGSNTGIGGTIQIPETQFQALLPFPAPPPKPQRECTQAMLRNVRLSCQATPLMQQLICTTHPQFTCAIVPLPFISSATSARTSNFFKASRSEINIVEIIESFLPGSSYKNHSLYKSNIIYRFTVISCPIITYVHFDWLIQQVSYSQKMKIYVTQNIMALL